MPRKPAAASPDAPADRKSPGLAEVCVTQQEIAAVLGITDRQVRNLQKAGFPRDAEGRYPVARCVAWYVQHRIDDAVNRLEQRDEASGSADERLTLAKAQREEIKLERERGKSVTTTEFRIGIEAVAGAIRGKIDYIDSEYHLRILHITDPAVARIRLGEIKRSLLDKLQGALDTVGEDSDDDAGDGDGDDEPDTEVHLEPEPQEHGGWLKRTRRRRRGGSVTRPHKP